MAGLNILGSEREKGLWFILIVPVWLVIALREYNQVGRRIILLTLSQENNLHVQHRMLMHVIYIPPPAEHTVVILRAFFLLL